MKASRPPRDWGTGWRRGALLHGVLQVVSIVEHDEGIVRGTSLAGAQHLRTMTGDFANSTARSWAPSTRFSIRSERGRPRLMAGALSQRQPFWSSRTVSR
jgi:hypothetical protein